MPTEPSIEDRAGNSTVAAAKLALAAATVTTTSSRTLLDTGLHHPLARTGPESSTRSYQPLTDAPPAMAKRSSVVKAGRTAARNLETLRMLPLLWLVYQPLTDSRYIRRCPLLQFNEYNRLSQRDGRLHYKLLATLSAHIQVTDQRSLGFGCRVVPKYYPDGRTLGPRDPLVKRNPQLLDSLAASQVGPAWPRPSRYPVIPTNPAPMV